MIRAIWEIYGGEPSYEDILSGKIYKSMIHKALYADIIFLLHGSLGQILPFHSISAARFTIMFLPCIAGLIWSGHTMIPTITPLGTHGIENHSPENILEVLYYAVGGEECSLDTYRGPER
jgi:hypothetical protein